MELWIARDENNKLYLYEQKPILKNKDRKEGAGYMYFETEHPLDGTHKLGSYLFPEVTFENSPKKVELKLVEE